MSTEPQQAPDDGPALRVVIAEDEALEAEIEAVLSPAELERIAREQYGMVRPGETSYVVELDGGPVISQVVIPILETDDAARLAARLGPREHELIVATVDMMTRRRVECDGSVVRVDGDPLQRPFRLQEDGTLDETS